MSKQPQNAAEQAAIDNWKTFYRAVVYVPSATIPRPSDPFGLKEFLDENEQVWEESRWDDICAAFLVGQGIPVGRAVSLGQYMHYHWSCEDDLLNGRP